MFGSSATLTAPYGGIANCELDRLLRCQSVFYPTPIEIGLINGKNMSAINLGTQLLRVVENKFL